MQGWFIGWDDSWQITDITDRTWTNYWKNQYVLWDYQIEEVEEEKDETITIWENTYSKKEFEEAVKNLKTIKK